jgi:hypothetical protein
MAEVEGLYLEMKKLRLLKQKKLSKAKQKNIF